MVERLGLWMCRESWAHKALYPIAPVLEAGHSVSSLLSSLCLLCSACVLGMGVGANSSMLYILYIYIYM